MLLSLNMSRWACHFTTTANLTSCGASNCVAAGAGPPCAPLPGEMGLGGYYGHYQGHYLSGTAMMWNNTRSAPVKAKAPRAPKPKAPPKPKSSFRWKTSVVWQPPK